MKTKQLLTDVVVRAKVILYTELMTSDPELMNSHDEELAFMLAKDAHVRWYMNDIIERDNFYRKGKKE